MADFPVVYEGQRIETAVNLAASTGINITANATPNTKGSWTTLLASSAFNASAIIIMVAGGNNNQDTLLDIAIGAAASEQVVCENLFAVAGANVKAAGWYYIPIEIPAGTRLSARTQSTTASNILRLSVCLITSGFNSQSPYGRVSTTYGANTADSGGVNIDPGGTINTDGSWIEIIASTSFYHAQLIVCFSWQLNTSRTSCTWLVDVAIGAAGSEQVIIPDILIAADGTSDLVWPPVTLPFDVNIPEGSRLAIRARCSINDATDRTFDAGIVGIG